MVELLEKTLPQVEHDHEAQVVCLDWYSAHRDLAVAEIIARRGHVLLLHGGGTTAFEQINDTHLHAIFQHKMKDLEVAVFYGQLKDSAESGVNKACSHSRKDLCMLVKEVWKNIDHAHLTRTGYAQTGPNLPLTGPIMMRDVCR